MKKITLALIGNPNAGKTTIFNNLTGARQKVGNWPGVTVEKKEGRLRRGDYEIRVVDLPGIYSLTAYSVEEVIARDFILEDRPDVVVDVIDASNLERNLYLAVQLLELEAPLVFAMNMVDLAEARGMKIDFDQLSVLLGVPIVKTVGTKAVGMEELISTAISVAEGKEPRLRRVHINYGPELEKEIARLSKILSQSPLGQKYPSRWLAVKLLEADQDIVAKVVQEAGGQEIVTQAEASRERIQTLLEESPEALIAEARYGFIAGALRETMRLTPQARVSLSDRIDQVVTNRLFGFPIFFAFMYLLFYLTFRLGEVPVSWIEAGVEWLGAQISAHMAPSLLRDLLVEGIVAGVGGVIVFLPNILLLFLGISLLEDTGYMARAAFIMDRVMHTLGLHGKSFIPLLMGFGCNVPALMATRTLESRKDRLLTILINPLMSCSARLPVYILFAGTFFPGREGNVIFAIYLLGIVLAVLMGQLFSKTIFRGEAAPFVLELPPYRLPTLKSIIIHMWDKTKVYLQKMGGVVLAFSVILWALTVFPRVDGHSPPIEESYIGRAGRAIEPFIAPLGFNWQMGVSLLTGFVAKEVVVSSMGVLYQVDEVEGEEGFSTLSQALKNSGITPLTAFAFMAFVLIYVPCIVSVVTIWRETGSIGWTLFAIGYLVSLAWIVAFVIRQVGLILGLS
ncbi:ferrous iron transport protein B [Thermosulfuriphilus ammonigenes]|uniref:ferrous iron transport protein B n=1 Tax=Thermosulfuriphilus ammonigenes TaxID=1936021 RepID=UPI0015EC7C11|nr:ferrous iron transport protein B [Thermosulfuriphilus ammonigenes]MBA2848756.1 ferrous iron transport protein B [Thermosulfuriphilus ammonigenes]